VTEVGALYGRLSCSWLGVVCVWLTHATVGSGRGWLSVVVARLGATGRCASTAGRSIVIYKRAQCSTEV